MNIFNIPYLNQLNNFNNGNNNNNNNNNQNNDDINNQIPQIDFSENSNNKNIVSLIYTPIKIKIHEHPLIFCETKERSGQYICDSCSSNFNFNIPSFYCTFCDFDLCQNCLGKFQLNQIFISDFNNNHFENTINLYNNNILYWQKKFVIHNHPLTLIKKPNKFSNWICDYCNKKYTFENLSYYCSLCDFDLCEKCSFNNLLLNNNQYINTYNNNNNNNVNTFDINENNNLNNNILDSNNNNESFQINSFKILNENYSNENFIYNPFSLNIILSLLANGTNGQSLLELKNVLSINNLKEENTININLLSSLSKYSSVNFLNAIFAKFFPSFDFSNQISNYNCLFSQNPNEINNYISKTTNNETNNFLNDNNLSSDFILINILYFKGEWKKKFNPNYQNKYFLNSNNSLKNVQMIECQDSFKYFKNDFIEAIEISYKNDNFYSLILLPDKNNNSIGNLINNLTEENLNALENNLNYQNINLIIPKFNFDNQTKINLIPMLKKMGLKSIFNSQEADFSKLIDNSNIKFCINEILQCNSININEIGTQIFENKNINLFSSFFYEKEMVVDRPFIFIVKNKKFYKKRNIILIAKIEDL